MANTKDKNIDITKTGPQGFRQLQDANEADKKRDVDLFFEELDAANPVISTVNPYANSPIDLQSPLYGQSKGWGESKYDTDTSVGEYGFERLADTRAENQPWYSKIAHGLGKGVILTGTTFLDGTVGLVIGAGTAISEGRWSGLWDNDFSKAMQAINEKSEELLPNYYTEREQELSRTNPISAENIFSANFIGDKFLKNLGFAVGAYYSGAVASKAIQATKIPQLFGNAKMAGAGRAFEAAAEAGSAEKLGKAINMVGKAVDAPAVVTSAVGATISAVNEGRIEALNNTKDWYNLEYAKLSDHFGVLEQQIEDEYAATQGQSMIPINQGDGVAYIDPAYLKYQDSKRALQNNYEQALAKLNEDRAKMGNADLLMNLPILMASNMIEFGKMYANGYKTARKGVNIINKSKYADKSLSEAWDIARKEGISMQEFAKEFAQFGAKESKKGIMGGLERFGKNAARTSIPEGLEEISQKAASTIAGDYYSADIHNFYKAKTDPDATQETVSWAKAFMQGINETINDGSSWEEFFIGALTGALGMPVFGRANTNSEDTYLGKGKMVGLRGGMFGEGRANKAEQERANTIANYINDRLKDPKLQAYYQGLTRHNHFQKGMNDAAVEGNELKYKDHEFAQMVSDIMMFDNVGKIGDLLTLVNSAYDTSPENLAAIVKNTTSINTDASGKKTLVGPFAQYATINSEGQVAPNFGDEAQQKEMAEKLTKTKEEMLKTISDYQLEKDKIDIMTGQRLNDDQLQELTWIKMQSKDWTNRGTTLAGEVRNVLSHISAQQRKSEELAGLFKREVGAHSKPKTRIVDGKEVKDFGPTEEYEALSEREKVHARNVAALDTFLKQDDEGLFLALGRPENKETVEAMKTLAKELVTVSPEEIEDFNRKIDDIGKLSEGIRSYNTKLKEFLKNPEKQASEMKAADQTTAKKEEDKKRNAIARRINFEAPTAEVAKALDENSKDIVAMGGFDEFVKTLSPAEAKKAKAAKHFSQALNSIKEDIDSSDLTDEQKRVAHSLLEKESTQAKDIKDVGQKISVALDRGEIRDAFTSAIPTDSTDDAALFTKIAETEAALKELFDDSVKKAADAVSALEKTDSSEMKKAADALKKKEESKEEKVEKAAEAATKADEKGSDASNKSAGKQTIRDMVPKEAETPGATQVPKEKQVPGAPVEEDEPYEPQPGEAVGVGRSREVKEKQAKEVASPSFGTGDTAYSTRPQLSQYYLHGRDRLTYLNYIIDHPEKIPSGVDKEAFVKYIGATLRYLTDHGAFSYVSGINPDNKLSVGDTIEFKMDEELNKEAGTKVVLMVTKNAQGEEQVIGSLPSELDFNAVNARTKKTEKETRPAQYALYQEVIKQSESTEEIQLITTKVSALRGGRIEFSDKNERSIALTFAGTPQEDAPVIAVLSEETSSLTTGDDKLDSQFVQPTADSNAVMWGVYAMVPTNNGRYLPALCYSAFITDIIDNPDDWYIQQTIAAIKKIPTSIADLKDNIKAVYKWLNIPGLSLSIGRLGSDHKFQKETADVSQATHVRMSFSNPKKPDGPPISVYFDITNGELSDAQIREKLSATIKKNLSGLTTNVDIKRLTDRPADREYRKQIAKYLYSNVLAPHSVNDWFSYEPTDIERDVNKKEKEEKKPTEPIKKEGKGPEVKVSYNGKEYTVTGNVVLDSDNNPVDTNTAAEILKEMAKPEGGSPVDSGTKEVKVGDKVFTALNMGGGKAGFSVGKREAKSNRWSKKLRVTDTDDEIADEKQIYADEETVRRMLPQLSQQGRIIVVNGLIKTVDESGNPIEAYGEFRDGILYISNQSPMGTAYHEAFHYVTTMLMDEAEQATMLAEARKQYGDLSDMALEEKLAESFRDFMNGYNDKSLIGRIKTFFRNLKHVIDGLTGRLTYLDSLFFNIYRGRYADRQERFGTQEEQRILREAPRDSQGRLLAPNGKPSNLTERQYAQVRTQAFKDWFGDWENDPKNASKVVDENGEPRVVYHHTRAGVSEITEYRNGELANRRVTKKAKPFEVFSHKYTGTDGFYFTSSPTADNIYTPNGLYGEYTTIPVFLNIRQGFDYKKNSHTAYKIGQDLEEARRRYEEINRRMNEVASRENFSEKDQEELDKLMQQEMAAESDMRTTYISDIGYLFSDKSRRDYNLGNNGIIEISDTETFYVVNDADQIKSATENTGMFSPRNDNFYDRLIQYKQQQLSYNALSEDTKQSLEAKRITQEDYEDLSVEDKESILFCLL